MEGANENLVDLNAMQMALKALQRELKVIAGNSSALGIIVNRHENELQILRAEIEALKEGKYGGKENN